MVEPSVRYHLIKLQTNKQPPTSHTSWMLDFTAEPLNVLYCNTTYYTVTVSTFMTINIIHIIDIYLCVCIHIYTYIYIYIYILHMLSPGLCRSSRRHPTRRARQGWLPSARSCGRCARTQRPRGGPLGRGFSIIRYSIICYTNIVEYHII